MPAIKETKQERLRRKLVNNEINPIVDALLTIFLISVSPFIWLFSVIHDKLMFNFLNNTYIYNVSWEDPRMDHRVFNLKEDDHVITIASAGCNALDYIIEGAMVTAVDFNLCQIALTEIKKVAIIHLEFDAFFEIFSNSNMAVLQTVYPTLRPHLTKPSAEFWDSGIYSIKSFMYSGTSGNMSYVLFRILFPLFGLGFIRRELLKGTSKEDLAVRISANSWAIRGIAWLLDNVMLRAGCCFAGVPERQMELGLHRPNNLALVIERVLFGTDLVNDNYFYSGYFLGHYTPDNCPRYLRKENFAKMKKHLKAGKLILVHGTMLDAIDNSTTPITVASLLDHMDWMTDRMINEEMTHLARKMDPIRGKIFWRTFADEVHSSVLNWLDPERVDDSDDRVGMYWTTWISSIKNVPIAYDDRVVTNQNAGFAKNLITGFKIVSFPFWKPIVASTLKVTGHARDMESFYKYQKEGYDAFRENFLHARPLLMEAFPLKKDGKMVWIDIGGGTARNLEFFPVDVVRKYFKKIVIVDISASLLEMASRRIKAMGLEDIASVVEHDVTKDSLMEVLPKAGTVDVVTMSYSYSMIPDQQAALANCMKLTKKGGFIGVADFFLNGNYDEVLSPLQKSFRQMEAAFHKKWFSFDHIHLLQPEKSLEHEALELVWDKRERGAVPFLPLLKPYHGVYIMRKK